MKTLTVRLEGGILAPDVLERLPELPGQAPKDFGLPDRWTVLDHAGSLWEDVRLYWETYRRRLARAGGDSATTITREAWAVPLLEALGYRLTYQRSAAVVDGAAFPISHRDGDSEDGLPVHIVGSDQDLGRRPPAGQGRLSPHALLQEYLNRSEHLWGIVTNGHTLRILRQAPYVARQAYIEFDLQTMLEGDHFDEFLLLFRLAHRTRLPKKAGEPCLLEDYHQRAIEEGGRIRDKLRDAVEAALLALGTGFLRHPRNEALRAEIRSGKLSPRDLYRELLHLVYRLFFLLVAEERGLLSESPVYQEHYSLTRLQALAADPPSAPGRFSDLYLSLRTLFQVLRSEAHCQALGLPPLNGELFSPLHMEHLEGAELSNRDLLRAIELLSYFEPEREKVRRRVNYAALDVEELGSVYESLLELEPVVSEQGGALKFEFGVGTERKSTGSYYTPRELVHELVESALVPVLQDRLKECRTPKEKEEAILSLKVCDPACGSGHFLLAAARRLGRELARVRTGEDEPAPEAVREAVREVIAHCIHGVDKNPLAVELCKVALWIEGHAKGKPLTFLDHRIRCGDSLVGVTDLEVLEEGIPDEAYKAVAGDDKAVASQLKKENRAARKERKAGFLALDLGAHLAEHARRAEELSAIPDDRPEDVNRKAELYARLRGAGTSWDRDRTAANLWTAAFFSELTPAKRGKVPTSRTLWDFLARGPGAVSPEVLAQAEVLAGRLRFFHWPLEFPEVFAPSPARRERDGVRAGFDVVLGNPPWDQMQFDAREFFAVRAPEIANTDNTAQRERLIRNLESSNPVLFEQYQKAYRESDCTKNFVHSSGRFPLTSFGRINLAPLFAELALALLSPKGRAGLVVPSGIATDSFNQYFFNHLVDGRRLASLFDFENREGVFPGVHRSYKFSLLTMRGEGESAPMEFAFFATRVEDLRDGRRRFTLTPDDLRALNPNTRTCPVFRTRQDAELTKAIYRRVPVLVNEALAAEPSGKGGGNPWSVEFKLMFMMNTDSGLFRTRAELEGAGYVLVGNRFLPPSPSPSPLVGEPATPPSSLAGESLAPPSPLGGEGRGEGAVQSAPSPLCGGGAGGEGAPSSLGEGSLLTPSPLVGEPATPPSSLAGESPAPPSPLGGEGRGEGPPSAGEIYLPLYEAKMIWHFDHRYGTYEGVTSRQSTQLPELGPAHHADPARLPLPWYWVPASEVEARLSGWPRGWLLGFRRIGRSTDERTFISVLLPRVGAGDVLPVCIAKEDTGACLISLLLANLNSVISDYVTRQKIGGIHLDFHYVRQIPALPPSAYTPEDLRFIVPRVLELVYTAWDVKPFADDVWRDSGEELRKAIRAQWEANAAGTGGHAWAPPDWLPAYPEVHIPAPLVGEHPIPPSPPGGEGRGEGNPSPLRGGGAGVDGAVESTPSPHRGRGVEGGIPFPPFKWDEGRRAILRAELDAYYARLYGLTRKQLRYILDPADLTEKELQDILDPWEEVADPLDPQGYAERCAESTFPGETFRVLKEKETRLYGEYRTRRLILHAWEKLGEPA